MSGKVPPSSRAQSFTTARSSYARAARLYERFTGHDVEELGKVNMPPMPKVVAVIGECDGVLYTTTRDGALEKYIHEFADKDKPLLCVSPNGRQLLLVGGAYLFTERGIVDSSDKKNMPG